MSDAESESFHALFGPPYVFFGEISISICAFFLIGFVFFFFYIELHELSVYSGD